MKLAFRLASIRRCESAPADGKPSLAHRIWHEGAEAAALEEVV